MVMTEQDEAADETRSSYDEICNRTSTEETSTSWRSRLEQRKKMLEEFDKLEIDVSLSRKEAAQHGQWRCQRLTSVSCGRPT